MLEELFCSSNTWASDSFLQEEPALTATHEPCCTLGGATGPPKPPVSFFESHNDQIAVQKIKHYTNICINNLFECISSPLIDHVHIYDTWSVMAFQILPFSILTATVLHVDILSIPKAEASTTFPKAPWPRVLPSKGKRHLISGRVSELSVPQAEISLSVRQCN